MARKHWRGEKSGRGQPRRGGFSAGGRSRASSNPENAAILYGWHTVKAALENPARRIRKIWATENAARRLAEEGVALPLPPELVRPDAIDAGLGPDAVHQGLPGEAETRGAPSLVELPTQGLVLGR